MTYSRYFSGELIGTFLLVFFGCGAVAVTVLFGAHTGLLQVALVWGVAVTLAIYATRHLCCAHLNPAVSLAMVAAGRMRAGLLPVYLSAQFAGAFLASLLLYILFADSIAYFESIHGIVRGTPASVQTAMMFGEFFPNPGAGNDADVSVFTAFLAEAMGTFALVFLIFSLTEGCNLGRPDDAVAPVFIGLAVAMIIAVIAPLTQAGINPARDLSPRLFSMLAGWGHAALPGQGIDFLTVYVMAPCVGGLLAALLFTRLIEPLMKQGDVEGCCNITDINHTVAKDQE